MMLLGDWSLDATVAAFMFNDQSIRRLSIVRKRRGHYASAAIQDDTSSVTNSRV